MRKALAITRPAQPPLHLEGERLRLRERERSPLLCLPLGERERERSPLLFLPLGERERERSSLLFLPLGERERERERSPLLFLPLERERERERLGLRLRLELEPCEWNVAREHERDERGGGWAKTQQAKSLLLGGRGGCRRRPGECRPGS